MKPLISENNTKGEGLSGRRGAGMLGTEPEPRHTAGYSVWEHVLAEDPLSC